MIDKIFDGFYKVLFVLAVFVSFYYFGVSFSLLVSLAFIFLLFVQKALQRILSSGISLFAPFVLNAAKTSMDYCLLLHQFFSERTTQQLVKSLRAAMMSLKTKRLLRDKMVFVNSLYKNLKA